MIQTGSTHQVLKQTMALYSCAQVSVAWRGALGACMSKLTGVAAHSRRWQWHLNDSVAAVTYTTTSFVDFSRLDNFFKPEPG